MNFSKLIISVLSILVFYSFNSKEDTDDSHLKLWYNQPADASDRDSQEDWTDDTEWLKALPFGGMAHLISNMVKVVEPGIFEVMVGSSSDDIRLKNEFKVFE